MPPGSRSGGRTGRGASSGPMRPITRCGDRLRAPGPGGKPLAPRAAHFFFRRRASRPLPDPGTVRRCASTWPAHEARRGLPVAADGGLWFEVAAERRADGGPARQRHARRPAGPPPKPRLRDFVQTLSKTFAQMPPSASPSSNKRREADAVTTPRSSPSRCFQPQVPLAAGPASRPFSTRCATASRMPEPKNYRGWPDQIARWNRMPRPAPTRGALDPCPTVTVSVPSGRPHPDGAVAFMFENITSEMSLTRKFRGDLDLYRSALDESALRAGGVFGRGAAGAGQQRACVALGGGVPAADAGDLSLTEAIRGWQAALRAQRRMGGYPRFRRPQPRAQAVVRREWRTLAGSCVCRCAWPRSAGGAMSVTFQPPRIRSARRREPPAPLHAVCEPARALR